MTKETIIELYAPTLNSTRRFEIGHATRILQNTYGGWILPENSRYEFVNNELKIRTNKRKTDESE